MNVHFIPGWSEQRGRLHLRGAESPLPFLSRFHLPPFFHSQSLYVALGGGFGRSSGAGSEVTVAACRLWGVAAGVMGGRGVCRVRGLRGVLCRSGTIRGAELGVAGAAHDGRRRDDSQDPPAWVGSLPGDWRKREEPSALWGVCEHEDVLFMCLSLSRLTGTIGRRQRGFPDGRQGAAVLLNLVHAHRTIPHCVFMVVDRRRAANSSLGIFKKDFCKTLPGN